MAMNETDDIEVEYLEPDTVEEEVVEVKPKSGVGFIPVLGVGMVAAILGAVGGTFGAQYFTPKPDLSAVQAQIERAVADVKDANTKEIASLKNTVQTLRQQTSETTNQSELTEKIAAINRRLESLENAPEPTLSDISPETLNALQAAQADGFVWPDTDELETELSDVKAELALLKSNISSLEEKDAAIFDALLAVKDLVQLQNRPENVPLKLTPNIEFPKMKMLAVVESETTNIGFLARALNKHVKVKDANDPTVLIEQISTAIENDDIKSAIAVFDKLPEDMRVIGQDWRNSVQIN